MSDDDRALPRRGVVVVVDSVLGEGLDGGIDVAVVDVVREVLLGRDVVGVVRVRYSVRA